MASHPIYQFFAELDGYKPKMWRRFQTSRDITVARLGYIVQTLFEMKASHLMAIEVPFHENYLNYIKDRHPELAERDDYIAGMEIIWRYEIIDESLEPFHDPHRDVKVEDAAKSKLKHILSEEGSKINVNYDFGDNWWVSLTLEKIIEDAELPGSELPRVFDGEGYGIIEDVGGIGGLQSFAKAFMKKKGTDYKEFCEWLGITDFDMAAFDIDDMNFRLRKVPRIFKQIYEDGKYPTKQSIDLLDRKYLKNK